MMIRTLPVLSILPQGSLLEFLKTQLSGITGHIERAGAPFTLRESDWIYDDRPGTDTSWVPYEQKAY